MGWWYAASIVCVLLVSSPTFLLANRNYKESSYRQGKHNEAFENLWEAFKSKYEKVYTGKEDVHRRSVWEDNVAYIQQHNLEYDLGSHSFTLGLNEYADLTLSEYRKLLLGFRPRNETDEKPLFIHKAKGDLQLPDTVDWRKKGYVTPIKNQGSCGSCWAFSSTGSLEGQHFRVTGQLTSLSEQNLVDCTQTYGNAGCNGGWMNNAFKYVTENPGIDTEESYPYEAKTLTCRFRRESVGALARGYTNVDKGDEQALKSAAATMGPISVAIDATHRSFQLYRSGVYDEPECSSITSDHAVLVVGYGTQESQDYWLVKNSWGTTWGMDGYIMMTRNNENQCAIATYASYPIV